MIAIVHSIKKLFKFKKLLTLKDIFIILRLAFADIWIKTKVTKVIS